MISVGIRRLKKNDLLSFGLAALGVALIWIYLDSVRLFEGFPFSVLITGVLACSFAMVLLYANFPKKEKSPALPLLSLFLISYAMLTLYSFRYDMLGGFDVIGEYTIALKSFNMERWPIDALSIGWGDRAGRYANCLSVSLLPAVLSKVSGISMIGIFKLVLPAISAFVPLLLYLLIKEIFEDAKLAYLSGLLFATSHLQIFMLSYMFREQIGYFFLLLFLYILIKFEKGSFLALIPLAGLLLADGGHVAADIAVLYLLAFSIAPFGLWVKRRRRKLEQEDKLQGKTLLPLSFLAFYVSAQFLWLSLVASRLQVQHIEILNTVIFELPQYIPVYLNRVLTTGQILPTNAAGSFVLKTSPILDFWYYLSVIMPAVALLYGLFRLSNTKKRIAWITSCFLVFALFGFVLLAEVFIVGLTYSRILSDPIVASLTALLFYLLWNVGHSHKRKIFFRAFTLFLIFLSLSMNMSLIDHQRILHYHSENSVPPESSAGYSYIDYCHLQTANWIKENIRSETWISVDLTGFNLAYLADHVNKTTMSYPIYSVQSRFLIIPSHYWKYGLWVSAYPPSIYPSEELDFSQELLADNLIYNNGKIIIISRQNSEA